MGQPSWVRVESVPDEESSMIVLAFSAGEGFKRSSVNGGDEVETDKREDFGTKGGVLRNGQRLGDWRWGFFKGEKVDREEERVAERESVGMARETEGD